MRVKIELYDQIKGKGVYSKEDGTHDFFSYRQFLNEQLIPPGEYAELIDNVLHPLALTWWGKLWLKIKGVIKPWLS